MTLRNRGEPSGFARVAASVMDLAIRRATSKDLARLKSILERRGLRFREGCFEHGRCNRDSVVDAWFEKYDSPQKDLVQGVRQVILDADPRVTETIKWQAPTFMYKGNIRLVLSEDENPCVADVPHRGLTARPDRRARGRR